MIQKETQEYEDAWHGTPEFPGDMEVAEFPGVSEQEAEEKTLADRLATGEGEKLAALKGDGVMSTQEHQRYLEATGSYIDGSTPEKAAPAPAAAYSDGKDSEMTLGVKQRNYDANQGKYIQQFMDHGFSRKQAEAEVARRRP